MANPANPHGFMAEFVFAGTAIPLWQGILKSAQVINEGDALIATLGIFIINPTAGARRFAGIAAETITAPATAQAPILFIPALESIVFSGQYGSTAAASPRLTQGLMYTKRSLNGVTLKGHLSNGTSPSNACAWLIGLKKTSAFGTFGEAMFVFGKSAFSGRNLYSILGPV